MPQTFYTLVNALPSTDSWNRSLQKVQGHTGPESMAWLLLLKWTSGGDVSANKRTSERNDAKPVI